MRLRLILLAFILFTSSISYTTGENHSLYISKDSKGETVYICKGPSSKAYHNDKHCQGLRNCSTPIYSVDISEAIELGRKPCGYCY
jgi:hypothetical protein